MSKKIQILYIHGGYTFRTKKDYLRHLKTRRVTIDKKNSWSGEYLDENLGPRFQIIRPRMPLQDNAYYEDWKMHFERFFPLLKNNVILIGQSLGGIFLSKYLSENKIPKKILSVYIVAAPYDDTVKGEDLCNGFKLRSDLSLLQKQTKNLYLMFSADDNVVPLAHAHKYKRKLPLANVVVYKSKNGHFQVEKFPEIIRSIKTDVKLIRAKNYGDKAY